MQTSQRIAELQTSIFTKLDNYRKDLETKGHDIINLGIGSPDMFPPPEIIKTLKESVCDPSEYGYAMTDGTDKFRNTIANWYKKRFNVNLDSDTEVLSLLGSQDGLAHISQAYLDYGDIGFIPDPGYPVYKSSVILAGGVPYSIKLTQENNYLPKLNEIPSEICNIAKIMFLNYPSNPLAATVSVNFFEEVVEFAKKNDIIICHDAAYSELYFDDYKPISFLEVNGAKEVGVEFHSLSKTFNMAGCRIGFVVGNKNIINNLKIVKSNIDYGIFRPLQEAGIVALNLSKDWFKNISNVYKDRRNILVDGLESIGWELDRPKASMFIWAKIPENYTSSEKFALDLLNEAGILIVPGTAFGEQGEGYVRLALVVNNEKLEEVIKRTEKFMTKLL